MLKMDNKAKLKTDHQSWLAYKLIRNDYFADIRSAKESFNSTNLQSLIQKDNNTKQWWKVLKQVNSVGQQWKASHH